MADKKKVLSIQTDEATINKLKQIAAKQKRSQAKTIEVLIDNEYSATIDQSKP